MFLFIERTLEAVGRLSAYPFWSFRTESVADSHPRCHSVARKLKERKCLEGIQTQLTSSQIEYDRRENWRQAWTIKHEDGSGWPTVRRILSRKCLIPPLFPEFLLLLFSQAFFLNGSLSSALLAALLGVLFTAHFMFVSILHISQRALLAARLQQL